MIQILINYEVFPVDIFIFILISSKSQDSKLTEAKIRQYVLVNWLVLVYLTCEMEYSAGHRTMLFEYARKKKRNKFSISNEVSIIV